MAKHIEIPKWAEHVTLNIGCGSGMPLMDRARQQITGKHLFIGIDVDHERIRHGQLLVKGARLENVHLAEADAKAIPLPNKSVHVVQTELLFSRLDYDKLSRREWMADHARSTRVVLDEIARVLKPGGKLEFYDTNEWGSEQGLRALLADKRFRFVKGWQETPYVITVSEAKLPILLRNISEGVPLFRSPAYSFRLMFVKK